MLPPGDLRNCMVALSEEGDLLARLFAHRFRAGDALEGHSFGNLLVAALTEITGDFAHAIQLSDEKYCGVAATLRPTAEIVTSYEIHPVDDAEV